MIIFNPSLFLLNLFWYLKIIHQACLPRSGCSNDLVNPLPPRQLNISPFLPPIIYPVLPKLFTFSLPIITTFYEGNYLPCFTLSGLVSGYPWPWRHSKLKLNREWGRGRPGEVQYLFNLNSLIAWKSSIQQHQCNGGINPSLQITRYPLCVYMHLDILVHLEANPTKRTLFQNILRKP